MDRKPILEARGLTKVFSDKVVFQNINFKSYEGEVISIIGPSGSGKTTFLRCLNFLEMPTSGKVIFRSKEINGNIKKELREFRIHVGMVFQNFNLWPHMTVIENIIEAPIHVLGMSKNEAQMEAMHLLEKVHMKDKAQCYPNELSGGQKQRVAIARGLAMKQEIVLFDEPTSALDPELVQEVLLILKSLAEEGLTMIIVTHELRFAKEISSKILFFNNGQIEVQGTPSQVFSQDASPALNKFISKIR